MVRRTKFAHFMALSHPYTVGTIATKFFKHVHTLHGLRESIVFDRDNIFLTSSWQNYLDYWELSCTTTLPITLKAMDILRELISASKTTSDAWSLIDQLSGGSGCLFLNGGRTQTFTVVFNALCLKHFMVINLLIWLSALCLTLQSLQLKM